MAVKSRVLFLVSPFFYFIFLPNIFKMVFREQATYIGMVKKLEKEKNVDSFDSRAPKQWFFENMVSIEVSMKGRRRGYMIKP